MARHKMLGNVDLLGLNSFGNPVGLSPIWGTLIGGGVAGGTTLIVEHTFAGKAQINADLIGFGAGLATSALMYAMPRTRHAALGAVLGTFLASGLRWLERVLLGTVQLPAATAQAASQIAQGAPGVQGLGLATTRQLGIARTRALNGLGLSTTAAVPQSRGTIPGVAGPRIGAGGPPVNLLGQRSAGQTQVALMGGPMTHGIAGHYGATHFH